MWVILRRMRSQWVRSLAALLTVGTAITVMSAGPIYSEAVATAGWRAALAGAPLESGNVQLRVRDADLEAIDAEVRAAVHDALGEADVVVTSSGMSGSYELPPSLWPGSTPGLTRFASYSGLERRADLVVGRWPRRVSAGEPVEAVVSEGAAERLRLGPGDALAVRSRSDAAAEILVKVVGVFEVDDPSAVYWWGDPLETAGVDVTQNFVTAGPLVVPIATLRSLAGGELEGRWRVAVDFSQVDLSAADRLRRQIQGLRERVEAGTAAPVAVDTRLPEALSAAQRSALVTQAGVLTAVLVVAVLASYALVFIAGLLAEPREIERRWWRARGAGRRHLLVSALSEGIALVVPAVIAGPLIATLGVRLLGTVGLFQEARLDLSPRVGAEAYAVAAGGGVLCALVLTFVGVRRRGGAQRRHRTLVQRFYLDLILLVLAVLAAWQLRRYGRPVTLALDGGLGVDPALVAAPALGLLAGGIVAMRLVPVWSRLSDALAVRDRGLLGRLGTLQIARRPWRPARVALLVTLTVAVGVFVAAFNRSWWISQDDQAAHRTGADLRALLDPKQVDLPAVALRPALGDLAGVDAVTPASRTTARVSPTVWAEVLALDAASAADVAQWRQDQVEGVAADILGSLSADQSQLSVLPLRGRPDGVAVELAVSPAAPRSPAGEVRLSAVIRDGHGVLYRSEAAAVAVDGRRHRLTLHWDDQTQGRFHEAAAGLALAAVELEFPVAQQAWDGSVEIFDLGSTAVVADGSPRGLPPASAWHVRSSDVANLQAAPQVNAIATDHAVVAFRVSTGAVTFGDERVSFAAMPGRPRPLPLLPVLTSRALMEGAGSASDVQSIEIAGMRIPVQAVGSAEGFPTLTSSEFLVVDLPTYSAFMFASSGQIVSPSEWWLAAEPAIAHRLADELGAAPFNSPDVVERAEVAERLRTDPMTVGLVGALVIGLAAAGAFAVIGFAVAGVLSLQDRRVELAVLAALGVSRRQLATALLLEGGFVLVLGLVTGTALGLLLAHVVLPASILTAEGLQPDPPVVVAVPLVPVLGLQVGLTCFAVLVAVVQLGALKQLRPAEAVRTGQEV